MRAMMDAVLMADRALNHVTYGVNAQLAAEQMHTVDSVVDATPLPFSYIGNEYEDDLVAQRDFDMLPSRPALVITAGGPVTLDGEAATVYVDTPQQGLTVDIRLFADAPNTAAGARLVTYYLHAVAAALRDFMVDTDAAAQPFPTKALNLVSVTAERWKESAGDWETAGVLVASFFMRDSTP